MDVARDISRAIAELDVSKLVIDLRGNTGGGIGCLRLMSILSAGRLGVGYMRFPTQNDHDSELIPISVPKGWRSGFRGEADQFLAFGSES